mgnify:CR=1 FL=1|tara:strand:+ start:13 stop:1023 length:1011 start_codon:yes stop_codon:yes gene_type:complete
MAAINFPNPGTQTPPNTFSPSSSPAKTVNGITYVWNGVGWRIKSTNGEGGGTRVIISEQAPGDAFAGDLWWDSGEPASLFIYYIDEDSKQWVPATPVVDHWYMNGGDLVTAQTGIDVILGGNFEAPGTITTNTGFYAERPSGEDTKNVFRAKLDDVITSYIKADGSANFDGGVSIGGSVVIFADGTAEFRGNQFRIVDDGNIIVNSSNTPPSGVTEVIMDHEVCCQKRAFGSGSSVTLTFTGGQGYSLIWTVLTLGNDANANVSIGTFAAGKRDVSGHSYNTSDVVATGTNFTVNFVDNDDGSRTWTVSASNSQALNNRFQTSLEFRACKNVSQST